MTREELLRPRFELAMDFPFAPCKVGEILEWDTLETHGDIFVVGKVPIESQATISHYGTIETLRKYPHLFKELKWWEKRKESEMPRYLRHIRITEVMIVKGYWWDNDVPMFITENGVDLQVRMFEPATEAEYLKEKEKA